MTRATVFACVFLLFQSALAHDVDLTKLPLGDGHLSSAPQVGYIWACRVDPGGGGAQLDGPWINKAAGTYDFTKKAVVSGQVTWRPNFKMALNGAARVFTSNDLPNHPTGNFPVSPTDEAYRYDRNPNSIREQSVTVTLPANPVAAAAPTCAPGAVGILLTGSVLFNALDAPGRDAVAHEAQDSCQGHPQISGVYHYHSVTTCMDDKRLPGGHSTLVGYALDGFGIFGRFGEKGEALSSSDLDACHGHSHAIPWDGKTVVMYHYHATPDFPYSVGCFHGSYSLENVRAISGPPPQGRGRGQPIGGNGGFGPPGR
ncbi:MAG: YHYH protein [Alphaproteobacteria bacterium]|nr:YHYH protein [Alphaproteobacteria bacterium]